MSELFKNNVRDPRSQDPNFLELCADWGCGLQICYPPKLPELIPALQVCVLVYLTTKVANQEMSKSVQL